MAFAVLFKILLAYCEYDIVRLIWKKLTSHDGQKFVIFLDKQFKSVTHKSFQSLDWSNFIFNREDWQNNS